MGSTSSSSNGPGANYTENLATIWDKYGGKDLISALNNYLERRTDSGRTQRITQAVKNYAKAITDSITEDQTEDVDFEGLRFRWVGSSFDGTKVPPPDEFDSLVILPSSRFTIITPDIKIRFENLVRKHVRRIERRGSFRSSISDPQVYQIRTGVKLEFVVEGLPVSVDLTPCVESRAHRASNILEWVETDGSYDGSKTYLISHGGREIPSSPSLEMHAMKSTGADAQRCMKILKLLCMAVGTCNDAASPETTFGMPYMLKQCLFYRFVSQGKSWSSLSDYMHCRAIIAALKERVEKDDLYYFFDQGKKIDVSYYGQWEIVRRLDVMLEKLAS